MSLEVIGGLTVGLLFGAIMQRARFCTVAAVSNFFLIRDARQLRAFAAAAAVAIAGTVLLETLDIVDIAASSYRAAPASWARAVNGGLLFGFGASLAGGCAGRQLVRAGEGALDAWLVLMIFAISGAITLSILGNAAATETAWPILPHWLAPIAVTVLVVFAGNATWRGLATPAVAAGAGIGFLVVAGWWLTGAGADSGDPESLIVTAPLAGISLALATGAKAYLNFTGSFVLGSLIGAAACALGARRWRVDLPTPTLLPIQLFGAAAMGVGAVTAGGCNIGVGLSGVSTLAPAAILAATAMAGGIALGAKWWEWHG